MSKEGLMLFASVLENAQETRVRLLNLAKKSSPVDKKDVRLSQMLDEMKDTVKDEFCKLTMLKGTGK